MGYNQEKEIGEKEIALIWRVARGVAARVVTLTGAKTEQEDLVSEGVLGILLRREAWHAEGEASRETFYYWAAWSRMLHYLRDKGLRVPKVGRHLRFTKGVDSFYALSFFEDLLEKEKALAAWNGAIGEELWWDALLGMCPDAHFRKIVTLLDRGYCQSEVARKLGFSANYISFLVKRYQRWVLETKESP